MFKVEKKSFVDISAIDIWFGIICFRWTVEVVNLYGNTSWWMIENMDGRFGVFWRGDGFGCKYVRLENSFHLCVVKFISFLTGKIILRKYITKKKMKIIIIYIILYINRKYIGYDYYCISILFEEDSIIKRGRYFDETIWIIRWI